MSNCANAVAQGAGHAVFVNGSGNIVGRSLHLGGTVAHGHADARLAQDGYVVAAIAKGHGRADVQP